MIASATVVATVSMTVSVQVARVTAFTEVRCPGIRRGQVCNYFLATVPGRRVVEARIVARGDAVTRGFVVKCHSCAKLYEVISHG